jgi:hypothetical protein
MSIGRLLNTASRTGSATDGQIYLTVNPGGTSVYLGGRLLLQVRDGTVIAFQADNNRECKLIQIVLAHLGLDERYTMIPGTTPYLAEYENGITKSVLRPVDLLRRMSDGKTDHQ